MKKNNFLKIFFVLIFLATLAGVIFWERTPKPKKFDFSFSPELENTQTKNPELISEEKEKMKTVKTGTIEFSKDQGEFILQLRKFYLEKSLTLDHLKSVLSPDYPEISKAAMVEAFVELYPKGKSYVPARAWFDLAVAALKDAQFGGLKLRLTDLLGLINEDGAFDGELKELYEQTKISGFLEAIKDRRYLVERLQSSNTPERDKNGAAYALAELGGPNRKEAESILKGKKLSPYALADLLRGLSKFGTPEDWSYSLNLAKHLDSKINKEDKNRVFMQIYLGISDSSIPGKSEFLLNVWEASYLNRLKDFKTLNEWTKHTQTEGDPVDPAYPLARAFWSEPDKDQRLKTENKLKGFLSGLEGIDQENPTPEQFIKRYLAKKILAECPKNCEEQIGESPYLQNIKEILNTGN